MLDAFDVMLYSLVLAWLMADLNMDKTFAGALGSLTLIASAVGGLIFAFSALHEIASTASGGGSSVHVCLEQPR